MPAARSFQPVRAEHVEAGREDGIGLRGVPLEGDGVGSCFAVTSRGRVSPRRARYFSLLRQRKVPKRKATLPCVSLRCATGNLRCSGGGCCRRTHCALARSVQTCCGKSEHEVRVSFGTRTHPPPCASRHAQKGVGDDPGHRYARPSLRRSPRTAHCAARSARVVGRAKQWPVCGPPPPAGCACGGALAGCACVPKDTHASCSDSPRLSERSAQRAVSSAAAPRKRPDAGPPRSDSVGVADWGSPFLCLLSFGEAKESECAAGRTSRPR